MRPGAPAHRAFRPCDKGSARVLPVKGLYKGSSVLSLWFYRRFYKGFRKGPTKVREGSLKGLYRGSSGFCFCFRASGFRVCVFGFSVVA